MTTTPMVRVNWQTPPILHNGGWVRTFRPVDLPAHIAEDAAESGLCEIATFA
jgi:hypothetical protein